MARLLFYLLAISSIIFVMFLAVYSKADCMTTYKSGDVIYAEAGIPVNVVIDDPQSIHDFYNEQTEGRDLPVERKDIKEPNGHFCGESMEEVPDEN